MWEAFQLIFAFGVYAPILALGLGLGCGCHCVSCEIYTDAFGDTDEAGWTQTSGTWTEASGYMATSSSSAKLTCDTTHPDAVPSHYVSVSMYGATSDELKVHVGTNHFAQVTIGSPNGCLALYDGATLLTKMLIDAPATTAKTLKVWYGLTPVADGADSQFAAQLDSGTILRYNVTRAGNGVALGTGTVGSTVRFDDFVYEKHYTTTDTSCKTPAAPTCTILTDNFTRADDTNIGCSFTETSGTWSIDTNVLKTTSSTAKATCETIHPQASGAISISASVKGANADDVIKIWTDATANNYGQLIVGTAKTLKVFVAGAEAASLEVTTTAGVAATMVVTQSGDIISAQIGDVCVTGECADPAGPIKAALGTGTITSTVTFDDFTLSRAIDSDNADCAETCVSYCADRCVATTVRRRILLTVTGFAASGGPDGDACCTDLNGEFIMSQQSLQITVGSGWELACWWRYEFPADICPGLVFLGTQYAHIQSLNLVAWPTSDGSYDWYVWWENSNNDVYCFTSPWTTQYLDCSVTVTLDMGCNQNNKFCNVPSLAVGAIDVEIDPIDP